MRSWFRLVRNPSDLELERYAETLNAEPFRHARPKVTVKKLRIWWKHERRKMYRRVREGDDVSDLIDQSAPAPVERLRRIDHGCRRKRRHGDGDSEKRAAIASTI